MGGRAAIDAWAGFIQGSDGALPSSADAEISFCEAIYFLRKIAIELALPTYSSVGSVFIRLSTKSNNSG